MNFPVAHPIPWEDVDWPEGFDSQSIEGIDLGITEIGLENPPLAQHLTEVWNRIQQDTIINSQPRVQIEVFLGKV